MRTSVAHRSPLRRGNPSTFSAPVSRFQGEEPSSDSGPVAIRSSLSAAMAEKPRDEVSTAVVRK